MTIIMLGFGKYRDKSIQEIYLIDIGYARWLYNQKTILEKKPEIFKYLNDKFQNDLDSPIVYFGKHKKKTLKWIIENDPKYHQWMLKSDWVRQNHPEIIAYNNDSQSENTTTT